MICACWPLEKSSNSAAMSAFDVFKTHLFAEHKTIVAARSLDAATGIHTPRPGTLVVTARTVVCCHKRDCSLSPGRPACAFRIAVKNLLAATKPIYCPQETRHLHPRLGPTYGKPTCLPTSMYSANQVDQTCPLCTQRLVATAGKAQPAV